VTRSLQPPQPPPLLRAAMRVIERKKADLKERDHYGLDPQ
jgi:hypothetical protein